MVRGRRGGAPRGVRAAHLLHASDADLPEPDLGVASGLDARQADLLHRCLDALAPEPLLLAPRAGASSRWYRHATSPYAFFPAAHQRSLRPLPQALVRSALSTALGAALLTALYGARGCRYELPGGATSPSPTRTRLPSARRSCRLTYPSCWRRCGARRSRRSRSSCGERAERTARGTSTCAVGPRRRAARSRAGSSRTRSRSGMDRPARGRALGTGRLKVTQCARDQNHTLSVQSAGSCSRTRWPGSTLGERRVGERTKQERSAINVWSSATLTTVDRIRCLEPQFSYHGWSQWRYGAWNATAQRAIS